MNLTFRDEYELCVNDYYEKGAHITMKKRKSSLPFISIGLAVMSILAIFKDSFFQKQQIYMIVALSSFVILYLLYHARSIHTESLLIIASIGITVKQSSLLGTMSRFYEIHQIEDVVIIEAVTMSKVIFQLVLIPKKESKRNSQQNSLLVDSSRKNIDKLHPLFQSFRPKLKDLQTVYRHIQEKLILPSQKSSYL